MKLLFITLTTCLVTVLAVPLTLQDLIVSNRAISVSDDALLLRAANEGQEIIVQDLLNNGTKANIKDSEGSTPLIYAAINGYESIARLLIQHEAKINYKDNRGRTSLHYATEGGHENVVKLLIEHGADPQIKTPGETSIDLAEMNGFTNIVEILKNHVQ